MKYIKQLIKYDKFRYHLLTHVLEPFDISEYFKNDDVMNRLIHSLYVKGHVTKRTFPNMSKSVFLKNVVNSNNFIRIRRGRYAVIDCSDLHDCILKFKEFNLFYSDFFYDFNIFKVTSGYASNIIQIMTTKPVTLTIDENVLKRFDTMRGLISRSAYVNDMMHKEVENQVG